jgi:arginine/lysine/ornithine decarboxylase
VPLLVPGELITQDTIDYVHSGTAEIRRPAAGFTGNVKVLP